MSQNTIARRRFLICSSALAGGIVGANYFVSPARERQPTANRAGVGTTSLPSSLRITDLRVASLKDVPHSSTIVRIDTNQGLTGWGEVRDGASATYALMLKSRLLGENPCDVDRLFRKLKQFGGHGRAGGGVSGIEMALWDLAGKAYEVPVYQLLGGKFRDKIRIYADTPRRNIAGDQNLVAAARATGQSLLKRKERGLTWLKCDVGIGLLAGIPNAVSQPFCYS